MIAIARTIVGELARESGEDQRFPRSSTTSKRRPSRASGAAAQSAGCGGSSSSSCAARKQSAELSGTNCLCAGQICLPAPSRGPDLLQEAWASKVTVELVSGRISAISNMMRICNVSDIADVSF